MYQTAWDQIERLYTHPHVAPSTVTQFQDLKSSQIVHTKKEGALRHYCSFFLPYDQEKGMIYLGHHKKADDWIPPGGHIEPGETPIDAAIREMKEELDYVITADMIEPWNLSVKEINKPERGCIAHYDIWHHVHMSVTDFTFDRGEYHDARWFKIEEGVVHITKNPDFAAIVAKLMPG